MRVLITGAAGFLGHHVCEHLLKNTDWDIVGVDMLTYAANGYERLRDVDVYDDKRVTLLGWDISHQASHGVRQEIGEVDYILHLAAETHVDRSIADPEPFVRANVQGTMNVLKLARDMRHLKLLVNFSTDEVFGPAPEGVYYKEWDAFAPKNPYAATKAAAVHLGEAFANTYVLPVATTFTMNIFGERQHHEKFIPLCINAADLGNWLYIHADKTCTISGSRCWIHARNVAAALLWLLPRATPGQRYNIVGEEKSNLDMAWLVANEIGRDPQIKLVDFHSSRPGHDLRYALDGSKLKEMGWKYPVNLDESLRRTVRWSMAHKKWLGRFDD